MFNGQKSRSKLSAIIIMFFITVLLPGCAGWFISGPEQDDFERTPISPEPAATSATVTLYFADEQVIYLVPEKREVVKKGASLEEIVVKELIKGPANSELRRTIPPETRLLSLAIINGVAYVNFSGKVKNSGWGGSAGETMLVYFGS